MSNIPFRFLQRRTSTSGRTPDVESLLNGELYVQLADETIYFKNDKCQLVSVVTNSSKFGTGSFVTTGMTGNFGGSANTGSLTGVFAPIGSYVTANQTGNFITTSMTGAFGGASGVDLTSYVNTSQTGAFAPSGSYVTTSQTGEFAPSGNYVTTSQTGAFAPSGSYVTTSQTGQFAPTGSYVTTSQTGIFETTGYARNCYVTTGQTGTFGGGGSSLCSGINTIYESFTICSTGASGIINFDIIPNSTLLYIQNSRDNFSINLRGDSSCTFNDLLPLNNSVSVSVMHTNGSTGYSMTGVSIDGTAQTIKWSSFGGIPPGSANAENVYSITAFKTGNNLYKVYASLGLFS